MGVVVALTAIGRIVSPLWCKFLKGDNQLAKCNSIASTGIIHILCSGCNL